jgi:aryl-alcohol dehydrogenase-like predicted oxidoreductase
MERRTLGRTGLEVTVLGYGAMEFRSPTARDGTPISDEQAGRLLNGVLDGGINFIDTAPDYGLSEELIGKSIAGRRSEYYLATKCGCNIPRGDNPDAPAHIWTRDMLMHNIELSLTRMKTDYVDVWQMHNVPVEDVEKADLVRVMEDVKQQSKVRHVSISSTRPHISTYIERGWFASYQIPYSALHRDLENHITAAAKSGAGTIIRGGVAQGEPSAGRGSPDRWAIWDQAKLDELRSEGESRSALLLRMTLSHPHMHTTIVGTNNPDHLAENLKIAEAGCLPADVYAEAIRRLTAAGQIPL